MEYRFGTRKKYKLECSTYQEGFELANECFKKGELFKALDFLEQLLERYPKKSVQILSHCYEIYQSVESNVRYDLYQARHFDFGIRPGDKVLDIGSGHLPFPYATHLAEYYIEDNDYGRAGQRFKYVDGKPVTECSVEDMPFKDKEFDFVYCSHVLEHVKHPEKACKELMRVAKRGYIETPSRAKDLWLNTAKVSNHEWGMDYINDVLIFNKYKSSDIEGLQTNLLLDFHCSPRSDREKAFSSLIYLKADKFNVMFLWENRFKFEIYR